MHCRDLMQNDLKKRAARCSRMCRDVLAQGKPVSEDLLFSVCSELPVDNYWATETRLHKVTEGRLRLLPCHETALSVAWPLL